MMNLKKRLSSLLLALVVAATMMGGMTGSAFADAEADAPSTDNVEVVLNGGNRTLEQGVVPEEYRIQSTGIPVCFQEKSGKDCLCCWKGRSNGEVLR